MSANIFSKNVLSAAIRAGDSKRFALDLKSDRDTILDQAAEDAAARNIKFLPFFTTPIKGRRCISTKNYSAHLVFRSISRHLVKRFNLNTLSRDEIVLGVIKTLSDRTPMYIVRKDVASFYENLPLADVREKLLRSTTISLPVRYFVDMFFKSYCGDVGIPRGHVLSAVIAELAMQSFDREMLNTRGVYRYFRFSDDILLFSFVPPNDIIETMKAKLPKGLSFGASKSEALPVCCYEKADAAQISFEYLGYKFSFSDYSKGSSPREVYVGISDRKISKLKSRIIVSLKRFKKDKSVSLLSDRLKYLSGNYRIKRAGLSSIKTSKFVKSGIFYSYHLCGGYSHKGVEAYDCRELKQLDGFVSSLTRGASSEFAAFLKANHSQVEYGELRKISFFKGYDTKRSVRFDAARVHEIKAVWRSV